MAPHASGPPITLTYPLAARTEYDYKLAKDNQKDCKERRLLVTGNSDEFIERLLKDDREKSAIKATPSPVYNDSTDPDGKLRKKAADKERSDKEGLLMDSLTRKERALISRLKLRKGKTKTSQDKANHQIRNKNMRDEGTFEERHGEFDAQRAEISAREAAHINKLVKEHNDAKIKCQNGLQTVRDAYNQKVQSIEKAVEDEQKKAEIDVAAKDQGHVDTQKKHERVEDGVLPDKKRIKMSIFQELKVSKVPFVMIRTEIPTSTVKAEQLKKFVEASAEANVTLKHEDYTYYAIFELSKNGKKGGLLFYHDENGKEFEGIKLDMTAHIPKK